MGQHEQELGGHKVTDTVEPWKSWSEHWAAYAEAFAQPLQTNGLVSRFVTNQNVTGSYAEAWVRSTARSMLASKFRISTGAVIRPCDKFEGLHAVPQCDLVVWDPSDLPGLFECGEFALVPFAAVRALIEVKRSLPDKNDLLRQLRDRRKLVPSGRVLGVVVSHPAPLLDCECTPNWLAQARTNPAITRLLDSENKADTDGVLAFIYFLAQVAGHDRAVVR
jgi:hypothetical protein